LQKVIGLLHFTRYNGLSVSVNSPRAGRQTGRKAQMIVFFKLGWRNYWNIS